MGLAGVDERFLPGRIVEADLDRLVAAFPEHADRRPDVRDDQRQVVDPLTSPLEEADQEALLTGRLEQLELAAARQGQREEAKAEPFVGRPVAGDAPQDVAVKGEGRLDTSDGDPDVVEASAGDGFDRGPPSAWGGLG